MKKLLLLFCALLCLGGSGAWAQVTEITDGGYYYIRFRQATGWYVTPPTTAGTTFLQSNSAIKAIFRFDKVANETNTYTITCMNDGKFVSLLSGTNASGNSSDGRITTSSTAYNWIVDAGSQSGSWKIHPSGNTSVSWDPWNGSDYMSSHALTFVANRAEGDVQLMSTSVEGTPQTNLKDNALFYIDLYHDSNGGRYWTKSAGITDNVTYAGVYKLEAYTNAEDDGYYIKEMSSGKYVYASNLSSVSGANYEYKDGSSIALGATTLPTESSSANASENLSYYKWQIDATSKTGKWYIKPKNNTNTTIAIYYSTDSRTSYYKPYAWSEARFELPSVSQMLAIEVPFSDIVSYGYTISEIRAAIIANNTPSPIDEIGYTTTAAYTTFTTTINSFTTSNTYSDITTALNTMYSTVKYPTSGHYYIKNKAQNTYMYVDPTNLSSWGEGTALNLVTSAKHIWNVKADGSTMAITSSRGKNLKVVNGSEYSSVALQSAYALNYSANYGYLYAEDLHSPNPSTQVNSYGYNTSAAYDNTTNPLRLITYASHYESAGNYWTFINADDDYDIYDVIIEDGLQLHPTLECTLEGYAGNTVVYDGGLFAFTKGTSISAENFTAQSDDLDGYNTASTTVTVDSENKTITVVYVPTTSYTDLLNAYKEEHDIVTKAGLSTAGTVGYPKTTTDGYTGLYTILSKGSGYTAQDYIDIQSYYSQFLAETTVYLPSDGYTYTFTNIQKGGTKKYLYASGANLAVATLAENASIPESGRFVAHTLPDGKFFFVAKGTNYHFVIANGAATRPMKNGFSLEKDGYSPVDVFPMTAGPTDKFDNGVTNEDVFGMMYFKGKRVSDGNAEGIIIINSDANSFNSCVTTPYYQSSYTSAFKIERVAGQATETYYNTVNLRQAGDHSYASAYLPFAVELPSGVKAYKGTLSGETLNLSKIADGSDDENNVLPAKTAAILWSENATVTGNTTLTIVTSALESIESDLKGSLADNTAISGTGYVLYGNASSAGFYPLSDDTAPTCKAYLDIPASVKSFSFSFNDIVDGIQKAELDERLGQGPIYDLGGRRIEKPMRGIYIQNGRKFIIK